MGTGDRTVGDEASVTFSLQLFQENSEATSLENVKDNFLTNDLIIKRFYVVVTLQFLFLSVGWLVAHEMWKFFNPNADTELNIAKLSDFVLSDQTGLENAAINMGYGIASTLLFLVLTQLGNPSTSNKRRHHFSTVNTENPARSEE